ncbi:MAG: hypothetical protein ABSG64_14045 [Solirubrobacteraceae bacterium]|jgi:hypothetical protein
MSRAEGRKSRPRLSTGTVVATVALFFALGGTAWAAHHYLITSTKQIKPSVLNSLKGKAGPVGPTGLQGIQGIQGAQGPSADPFVVTGLAQNSLSPASGGIGPIPVNLDCFDVGGDPVAVLQSGASSGTWAVDYDYRQSGVNGAGTSDMDNGSLSSGLNLASEEATGDEATGIAVLSTTTGTTTTTETVDFSLGSTGVSGGTCSMTAQVVFGT